MLVGYVDVSRVRTSFPALPASYPPSHHSSVLPHSGVNITKRVTVVGKSSTTSGDWPNYHTFLTAMPSAAGRLLPLLRSATSCLLDLYHECVDNGGSALVLYKAFGSIEKLTFTHKLSSAHPAIGPPPPR
jgi:hypothetical protein